MIEKYIPRVGIGIIRRHSTLPFVAQLLGLRIVLSRQNDQYLLWGKGRRYLPKYCNLLLCPSAVHGATRRGVELDLRVKLGSDYADEPVPVWYGTKNR
jgi:hypothetical protein